MAEIELKNVSKEYDLHTLGVRDIELVFPDGSITTVVGAAGAGKSTLLDMIGGIVDVTSGGIFSDGNRIDTLEPRRRDFCLMRNGECACSGSVRKNISYGLKLRRYAASETEVRTKEAAELFGLTELLETKVKKLSELDRRRVSLARAAARRPHAFLVDDPFFALSERRELADDIKKLNEVTGITVIVASSFGEDAFLCGGRVVVMKEGRVIQTGSERELIDAPADMFVAAFVGEDPVGFILGEEITGFRASESHLGGEYKGLVTGSDDGVLTVKLNASDPPVRVLGVASVGDEITFGFDRGFVFDKVNGALVQNNVKNIVQGS